MSQKTLKLKSNEFHRSFSFKREAIDEEARTVELAFVSEEPVERYFGLEILDVTRHSMRLDRLQNGAALLVDHDHRGQIGVVESISIDPDRVGRAIVRFGKSERANEIFSDVVDGIRRHVSFGYRVYKAVLEEKNEDAPDSYRITDYEPFEISIVSVPADASVGIGRSYDSSIELPPFILRNLPEENKMPEAVKNETKPETENRSESVTPRIDINAIRKEELARIREINAIADLFGEVKGVKNDAREFIENERSIDEFRKHVLETMGRDVKPLNLDDAPADLGMDDEAKREYSIFKAILASRTGDWSKAGLEFEVSQALEEKFDREARGFFVPHDVLGGEKRDMSFAGVGQGQELVGTDHLAGSFIELLRNRSALASLGARMMDGLVGNVDIPKQTGGASFYWIDNETTNTTESNLATGQVLLSPKTVSGRVDITRRLLLQSSPSAEALVRSDLAQGIGIEIDRAGINGSGIGGEPTGILNTAGIGSVVGGVDGLAPTWDHMVDLETAVAIANADLGAIAYLTNSKVRGQFKKTQKFAGTNGDPVWNKNQINDYQAMATQQMPSNLTKGLSVGVASAILYGNFNDVIIAMWGGMDIKVDEITNADRGGLVLRVFQDIDIAVRRAQSFAAMLDALTG